MGINSFDDDDGKVNELVEMIDKLIADGDGHLTIDVDELSQGLNVKTFKTTDCGSDGKKGACCQPNEKVDEEEDF